MDDSYVRDRTEQILRDQIALGAGYGDCDDGQCYVGGVRRRRSRSKSRKSRGAGGVRKNCRTLKTRKTRGVCVYRKRHPTKSLAQARKFVNTEMRRKANCSTRKTRYSRGVCRYRKRHPTKSLKQARRFTSAEYKRKRGGYQMSPWIEFVKKFAHQNGITYGQALQEASPFYHVQ